MTSSDQERWDKKYRHQDPHKKTEVDPFVTSTLDHLGPGAGRSALDLAAGAGRHSLELARRGWATTAWDVSGVGLALLEERAQQERLPMRTERVDVLNDPPGPRSFDLLLCTDFLDRELWQKLGAWIRPGGHALLITFNMDWPGPKPSSHFRLNPGELAGGLPGFETVLHREQGGRSGILARRRGESEPG